MKKNVKSMIVIFCLVVIMLCSVFTTLAYLTDSKTVENTFTVGNVYIKLDEANIDKETGATLAGRTETGNSDVRLIPGRTIGKDPTVTVLANSENCYVRMKVKVSNVAELKEAFNGLTYTGVHGTDLPYVVNDMFQLHLIVDGWKNEDWAFASYDAANGVYEFRYVGALATDGIVPKSTADTVLPDLFTSLTIPGAMTGKQLAHLDNVDIIVTAEAIQAEGFADAAAAWTNFHNP